MHKEIEQWQQDIFDYLDRLITPFEKEGLEVLLTELVYEAKSVGYDEGYHDGQEDAQCNENHEH